MSESVPKNTGRTLDQTRLLMMRAVHSQQQGDFAEAERLYQSVLAQAPKNPDALHFLGLLKHQRDGHRSVESIELMRKGLEYGLPNAGYMANFGRVLQAHGRLEESAEQYKKAVALSPTFAEAWTGLGETYELMSMPFKASACYRKAYDVDPSVITSVTSLARSLRNTGALAEAASICAEALRSKPDELQLLFAEVLCLMDAGKTADALEKMRFALRKDPFSAQLHYSMGLLLVEAGNFTEAKEHYEKALSIDPQYYAVCYSLANIQSADADAVSALEDRIRRAPPKSPDAAVSAEFALAKTLDGAGDCERAFEHFKLGNRIMRQLVSHDDTVQQAYVDGLLKHLDAGFMARSTEAGDDSERPIFIVGMIRSGTSLVEQILASHPDVRGGGELPFLSQSVGKYAETPFQTPAEKIAALSDQELRAVGEHYLAKLAEFYPGAKRVTDKLPGNFMLLGLIRALFPKAHIIHCRRDPLDTCLSCYFTHFDTGHYYSYDLEDLGRYYKHYLRVMDYYERTIEPGAMLSIAYEELVNDVEAGARKLVEFCGLQWDRSCLEFDKTDRPVRTASMYQVRQPVYKGSVGKWRRYEKHIEPLRRLLDLTDSA